MVRPSCSAKSEKSLTFKVCQWKFFGEAAGGNPRIVVGSWPTPSLRKCRNVSPNTGYLVRAMQHTGPVQPTGEVRPASRPPVPPFNPLGEFAEGYKGDDRFPASEMGE